MISVLALILLSASSLDGSMLLGPRPPESPTRVVTLAPSLTDLVLKLGKGDALAGVSRFDADPAVKSVARVGGYNDPNVEAIVALHPQLVLAEPSPGNRRAIEKLAEVGIPVLALPLHSVAQTLNSIREASRRLGAAAKGERLAARIEAARARVRACAATLPKIRVLFVYGFSPLVVAGPGSFADELLQDAGGLNVARDSRSAFAVFPAERAMKAHPAVVIDAANTSLGREKLRALPGLREARWIPIPSPALLQPGAELGRGVEELFSLLHPLQDGGAPCPSPAATAAP